MKVVWTMGNIREYDMKSADLSVLAERGYISNAMYHTLQSADKPRAKRMIGCLRRDVGQVNIEMEEDMNKYTDMFIVKNRVTPFEVMEIAKDAVICNLNSRTDMRLKFGEYIQFVNKGSFSCCYEFDKTDGSSIMIKLYLSFDGNTVKSRYAKLDDSNYLIPVIKELLINKVNANPRRYHRALRSLISNAPKTGEVLSGIPNNRLIEVFRELGSL